MARNTRRAFLKHSAVSAGLIGATGSDGLLAQDEQAAPTAAPDLVLLNGRVYTMDDRQPRAGLRADPAERDLPRRD